MNVLAVEGAVADGFRHISVHGHVGGSRPLRDFTIGVDGGPPHFPNPLRVGVSKSIFVFVIIGEGLAHGHVHLGGLPRRGGRSGRHGGGVVRHVVVPLVFKVRGLIYIARSIFCYVVTHGYYSQGVQKKRRVYRCIAISTRSSLKLGSNALRACVSSIYFWYTVVSYDVN